MHKVSEQRSRNMSAIKSKNTKPEIAVRKFSKRSVYALYKEVRKIKKKN